jgi:GNAT superfamily N-acetyltransferase
VIVYRPAAAADAPAVAHVLRASMTAAMPWLPVLHTPDQDFWFVANTLLRRAQVTVADDAGAIVGVIAIADGWIEQLYLLESHWRRGIGTTLLDRVRTDADQLQLVAFQRNRAARRFYERRGFRAVAFTDGSGNEEKTPDVRYLWRADGSHKAGPALTFREMTVADIGPCLEMRYTTVENAITPGRLERQYGVTVESLAATLGPDLRGWLCEADGQVVGFTMADRTDGEIEVLAVRPGYEGLGVGRSLLELGRDWLFAEGWERIWLAATPDPDLRASGFYRALGWRPAGERVGDDEKLVLDRR